MTVQLSTLRVAPEMDASKYVAGAQDKIAADKAMAASSAAAGQAVTATDTKIGQAGDVLARLSRQYEQGYAAQQKFNQGLGQLNRSLESGKISVEGAERILVGMNQKLGLMGDASDLASKGQIQLAAAVKAANAQIAGQAIAAENATASAKRMMAANGNAAMGRQNNFAALNATNQFQDIAITAAMGQSLATIAFQQGTQLGMAMEMAAGAQGAAGAVKMLGSAITGLFTPINLAAIGITAAAAATIQWFMKGKDGAKSLDETLKAHSETLRLLKDQYGALGEAAKTAGNAGGLAFTGASARNALTLLQAQLREKTDPFLNKIGGVGWVQGLLGNGGGVDGLRDLSGDQKQFAGPMAALIESAKSGKTDLAGFNEEVERLFSQLVGTSDNPARLRATADAVELLGNNAFTVTGKFAPFADAINRLKVEAADGKPSLSAFNAEIERVGRTNGLQTLADETIIAGKEIVDLAEKAAELEKILQRIDREETRPGLRDQRALSGYVNRRSADLGALNDQFDADQQMARARTNAERLAAVEAQVRARAREDGDKGGGLQARVDRALADERNRQAIEERNATDDRHRSQARSIEAAKEELSLIDATTGEAAKLSYQYSEIARLKEEADKRGGFVSPDEVARIKETAAELGKIADAQTRLNLNRELDFERSQMFLSPQEQAIASRLRGTGLGADSPEAQKMRDNQKFADAKDSANGFLNDFGSELIDSGGGIGKALGHSILNALTNSMSEQWEAIFDKLATAFASALTGQPQGNGGFATAGAAIAGKVLGGSNDNYAPGAVTRAPLGALDGGSVAGQAWNFFKSKGLADHQVAGILGNIKAESAFNPLAVGDGGNAFGLFQHNDRRNSLFGHIGGKGNLGDVGGQLDFAWKELQTTEGAAFRKLLSSDDVRSATAAFGGFERPSGWSATNPEAMHNFSGRLAGAEQALAKFGGTTAEAAKGLSSLGGGLGHFGEILRNSSGGAIGSSFSGLFSNLFGLGLNNTTNFTAGLGGGFAGLIGYANGTESAPEGWAWVGERGPELRKLRAGDVIRNNQRSMQMAANANTPARAEKVELHVHVNGASGDDHVRMLAKQGAQEVLSEYHQGQAQGGIGELQRRFNSEKG